MNRYNKLIFRMLIQIHKNCNVTKCFLGGECEKMGLGSLVMGL